MDKGPAAILSMGHLKGHPSFWTLRISWGPYQLLQSHGNLASPSAQPCFSDSFTGVDLRGLLHTYLDLSVSQDVSLKQGPCLFGSLLYPQYLALACVTTGAQENAGWGDSLVVQWLTLGLSLLWTWLWSLGGELRSPPKTKLTCFTVIPFIPQRLDLFSLLS